MGSEDIIQQWEESCRTISEIASRLAEDPRQFEHLKELRRHTNELENIQRSLANALKRDDHEQLLTGFAKRMTAIAAKYRQSPLAQCAEQIQVQWSLEYPVDGDWSLQSLKKDVQRAERTVTEALEQWNSMRGRKADLDNELRAAKKQAVDAHQLSDRIKAEDLEEKLQVKMAEVVKQVRIARDRVFDTAGPDEKSFDPTRNYRREGQGVDSERSPRQAHAHEQPEREATIRDENRQDSADRQTMAKRVQTDGDESTSTQEPPAAPSENKVVSPSRTDKPDPQPDYAEEVGNDTPEQRTITANGQEMPRTVENTETEPVGGLDEKSTKGESALQQNLAEQSLWHFLGIGRPGIAHHVARLQGGSDRRGLAQLGKVISASMLARSTYADHGEVVNALGHLISDINPDDLLAADWEDHQIDAVNVLLFCALLRPALFAPSTGAASLLNQVTFKDSLTPLKEFASTVTDRGEWLRERGVRHSASTFKVTPIGTWQETFNSFIERVSDWQIRRSTATGNVLPRANRVWQALFRDGGCLNELCKLVSQKDDTCKKRVEQICTEISDRKLFSGLVRRTDRGPHTGRIEGMALNQLWNDAQTARAFGAEWQRLMAEKPPPTGFVDRQIAEFRESLRQCSSKAADTIETALSGENPIALLAALKHARVALDELRQVLNGETEAGDSSEDPAVIQ